ncbi:hypothetical protein BpHYR1_009274 [Brachionus plicatilis]|uniref:Uncharacterized protein n=1 Tax=Brachionus plicatilis TaxID=10195 RepID=A0A3M7Q6Y5_BRAPC|nr:hypothetical protein BpHYR1_009274 [Brachionus plicatilis]
MWNEVAFKERRKMLDQIIEKDYLSLVRGDKFFLHLNSKRSLKNYFKGPARSELNRNSSYN